MPNEPKTTTDAEHEEDKHRTPNQEPSVKTGDLMPKKDPKAGWNYDDESPKRSGIN